MFPSWPELAGLVLLALIAGLAVAIGHGRRRRVSPAHASTAYSAADIFLPLFSLAWLVAAYTPWVPDWIPVLRLVAGPGRYWLWFIVLAQVAWSAWNWNRPSAPAALRRAGWGATIGVFVSGMLAFSASAARLTGTAVLPGGDE
jgi:hypothetical protein